MCQIFEVYAYEEFSKSSWKNGYYEVKTSMDSF